MSKQYKYHYKLYFDGASRNNPGQAGAGIVIKKNDEIHYSHGYYLGTKTNNQAEYLAFLLGLFHLQNDLNSDDFLEVICDSDLIVKQIKGIYKVKNADLIKLNKIAQAFLSKVDHTIRHIPREENSQADKKANLAIDKKLPIPKEFTKILHNNDISYTF